GLALSGGLKASRALGAPLRLQATNVALIGRRVAPLNRGRGLQPGRRRHQVGDLVEAGAVGAPGSGRTSAAALRLCHGVLLSPASLAGRRGRASEKKPRPKDSNEEKYVARRGRARKRKKNSEDKSRRTVRISSASRHLQRPRWRDLPR